MPTILVIDNADDRHFLACLLRAVGGYTVITSAPDPAEYKEACYSTPDLIIVGIEPHQQGSWALLEHLQSMFRSIPVLATAMFAPMISAATIRKRGCVEFIEKPFNIDLLLQHIERYTTSPCHA